MASVTKDSKGNIQANTFATGLKKYGPGQIGAATSGTLPKAGYQARDRKKANSKAINSMLPKSVTGQQALDGVLDAKLGPNDPADAKKKALPPWLMKKKA